MRTELWDVSTFRSWGDEKEPVKESESEWPMREEKSKRERGQEKSCFQEGE